MLPGWWSFSVHRARIIDASVLQNQQVDLNRRSRPAAGDSYFLCEYPYPIIIAATLFPPILNETSGFRTPWRKDLTDPYSLDCIITWWAIQHLRVRFSFSTRSIECIGKSAPGRPSISTEDCWLPRIPCGEKVDSIPIGKTRLPLSLPINFSLLFLR